MNTEFKSHLIEACSHLLCLTGYCTSACHDAAQHPVFTPLEKSVTQSLLLLCHQSGSKKRISFLSSPQVSTIKNMSMISYLNAFQTALADRLFFSCYFLFVEAIKALFNLSSNKLQVIFLFWFYLQS